MKEASNYGLGGGFISTTQFISSWGKCSIFSNSFEEEKKTFFTNNFEKIRTNSSQGDGEYLSAYFDLIGCRVEGRESMSSTLQKNYNEIFGKENEIQVIESFNRLEKLMKQEILIFRRCNIDSP
jgi:hypothetical protein